MTTWLACGLTITLVNACAITPQPIYGAALQESRLAVGAAWGTSYGASEARVVGEDGTTHELEGNGDSISGVKPLTIGIVVPLLVAARASLLPWLEVGSHVGWYGGGAGVRARLNDSESRTGLFATLDGQLGYSIPHDDRTRVLGVPYAGRLLAEGTFRIGRLGQLLTGLGVSAGVRRHGIDADVAITEHSIDNPFPENNLAVQRPELRLECALGGALLTRWVGVQVTVVPYVVLVSGDPTSECVNCYGTATLDSFSQTWGLSLIVYPFAVAIHSYE